MGQKTHPYGLRLGIFPPNKWEDGIPTKSWKSRWFAKKDYVNLLQEDLKIRKFVKEQLKQAGVSSTEIARSSGRIRIKIFTARPGVLIGRRGSEIDKLRDEIRKITKSEVFIDPKEVPTPQIDSQLVAESIANQLERRIHFRRAMKKSLTAALQKGAEGIKIQCKGRLGGSEIARREQYKEGKIPLGTFRADIDYGFTEAFTTYGTIGVKVWIYKGEILLKKEQHERMQIMELERKKAEELAEQRLAGVSAGSDKAQASADSNRGASSEDIGKERNKGLSEQGSDNVTDA
ncbi:MAG: 30S ribosomal protein S3 [Candidatus Omnitrophica bacterium]|nr:30S ribosomal protein S3 [Candidatus Omnitrophota bacterium]